jgi:hypothetical protein
VKRPVALQFHTILRLTLLCLLACQNHLAETQGPFEPGPLDPLRLTAAARQAGFKVRELKADIPVAVRSRVPFMAAAYPDESLATLRHQYALNKVVAGGRDEWESQLLLKEWVHKAIPPGSPRVSYNNALHILEHAARGATFWCTHYTITYAECAAALGWQARKIGVDRKHGPEGVGSSHHGVAEVWSNQFRKWVVIDAQSNLHFEKAGIPLSAWEIRAEWLKDGGKSVDHVVGVPPKAVKKNPAITWWDRSEDETSVYFWMYLESRLMAAKASDALQRLIFPQDEANAHLIWYQNGDPGSKGSELHQGYLRNRFLPTRRIEDVYWTVGVVETTLTGAKQDSIQLRLDSYCPNRIEYQVCTDGVRWLPVKNGKSVEWELKANWNSLRLRTVSQGNVTGPETSVLMFLEPSAKD